MSDIQSDIDKLAADLKLATASGRPIDVNRLQQLLDMRRERDVARKRWEDLRLTAIQDHTRSLTEKLTGLKSKGRPDVLEKIQVEMDKFDLAAIRWLDEDVCPWEDSDAASIASGVLVLVGELSIDN